MDSKLEWKKVVLFGDSITEWSFETTGGYWGANIAHRLQRICDVVCRGFTGYNSRSANILLPHLIVEKDVAGLQAVTIFFGANDACLEDTPTKQNVPLNEYRQNLTEMIDYLVSIGLDRKRIIVINPPPYIFDMHKVLWMETMGEIPRRSEERVKLYATNCVEVTKSCGVQYLDIHSAMSEQHEWKRFFCDGLYLTSEGGAFLADRLWPLLEPCVGSRHFPEWDNLYASDQSDKLLKDYCFKLQ